MSLENERGKYEETINHDELSAVIESDNLQSVRDIFPRVSGILFNSFL